MTYRNRSRRIRPGSIVALSWGAFILCHLPLQADPKLSAPPLPEGEYSIHFDGTLAELRPKLQELLGIYVLGPYEMRDGKPGVSRDDVPVKLDFEGASLQDVMLALCRQTGTVYSTTAYGRHVSLLRGDVDVDGRPTAILDDYIVRIEGATKDAVKSMRFEWGQAKPETSGTGRPETLALTVSVNCRSEEADTRCAGLYAIAKAVLDTGETLESKGQPHWKLLSRPGESGREHSRSFSIPLYLPTPKTKATRITRLEGKLLMYRHTRVNDATTQPREGATFKDGDLTGRITSWERDGDELRVGFVYEYEPFWPQKSECGADTRALSLVTESGRELYSRGVGGSSGNKGGNAECRFKLDDPSVTIDHVRFRVVRRANAWDKVPFVIENIPVP